ncbi:peptide chain release factor N(5)-glutamine methyltransferase [Streptococcus cameli]
MNYAQLFAHYEKKLSLIGEEPESLSYIFKEKKNISTTDFYLSLRQEVTEADAALLEDSYQQLAKHIPAQYVLGYAYFSDMKLKVDNRVLIPRPETEELVQLILEENKEHNLKVLDLCTGSGAIGLALKKARPAWEIVASDISSAALEVARENANVQNLDINFILSDLFNEISEQFDMIVSNPPYIAPEDQHEVGLNVWHSEPHLALFAEDNGLAIYQKIAEQVSDYLVEDGKLYFEIGYKQGPDLVHLLTKEFPKKRVRLLKDAFGLDRKVVMDSEKLFANH